MELPNIADFFLKGTGILVFKIPILILIFLYALFIVIVISRLKAFGRIVQIPASNASKILGTFALVQLVLAISLFLLTLVIV